MSSPARDQLRRGVEAYASGRIAEAIRAFQDALLLDPASADARAWLARLRAPLPSSSSSSSSLPRVPSQPSSRPQTEAIPAHRAPPAPVSHLVEEFAPSPWDDGPAAATIVLDADGGLDLAAVADKSDLRPLVPDGVVPQSDGRSEIEVWMTAAKELFALGDFSGSLELIEKVLQVDPDHGEARDYLRQNEATLVAMYESKLGSLAAVPRLAIKADEIIWLNLDHRAGFLLAQIDGSVDYESLFALSGLPRLDTARILANLIADGVICVAP